MLDFEKRFAEYWDEYIRDNPDWMINATMRLYYEALSTLKTYIENPDDPGVSWENPSLELQYPAGISIDEDGIVKLHWSVTEDEEGIKDNLRKFQDLFIFQELTKGAILFKENEGFCSLPNLDREGQTPHITPFEYEFNYTVVDSSGRKRLAGGLVEFEFYPLVIDNDQKQAYFPVYISLDFQHYPPSEWDEQDQRNFLEALLKEFLDPQLLTKIVAKETVFLEIPSMKLYHYLTRAISSGDFNIQGNSIKADLSNKNKTLLAQLRMLPAHGKPLFGERELQMQALLREQVLRLNDLTADILDVITAKWLKQAKSPEDFVTVSVTEILRYRGLKPRAKGGYSEKQRKEIQEQIDALKNVNISVESMKQFKDDKNPWKGESQVIVLAEHEGDRSIWKVRPGDVFAQFLFGDGRQTALLSQKALIYAPYRQKWEKRLSRYLAWLWRIKKHKTMEGVRVDNFIYEVGEFDARNPRRTKDRLENALNSLQKDGIITGWQYGKVDKTVLGKRSWADKWRNWKILIEPPQEIIDQYEKIKRPNEGEIESLETGAGFQVKSIRMGKGLTIKQASEEIGISTGSLSKIENTGMVGKKIALKVVKWLKDQESN